MNRPPARRGVVDDVHVDAAGLADDGRPDARAGQRRRQPPAAADADDQLGGVDRPGELHQGTGHVVPEHLVEGPAQLFGEGALGRQHLGVGFAQPLLHVDVHGEQLSAAGARGDPRAPAEQGFTLGPARQGDHHSLAGLPLAVDVVFGPVVLQGVVDLVGQPEQGEFAQRGEVAQPEVVGKRRVDAFRRVDGAQREPVPQ